MSKRRLKYKKQELIGNEKHTYTENEYKKIINEILKDIDNTKLGILLGLYTGARIGELCALQFKDIDFNRKEVIINKTLQRLYDPTNDIEPSKIIISTPKTNSSNRTVPLTEEIIKILQTLNNGEENYILTGKSKYTEPRSFRRKYNNFMKSIDIIPLKFHSLRHTFASMNIENGTDIKTISEILGHSDIDVTLKIYTHTSEKSKQKAIEKFNQIFTKEQKKEKFNKKYKGNICCINKKTGKLDYLGTIKEVSEYINNFATHVVNCINSIEEDEVYNIIPQIEGITHKDGVYMGG
jgi:integrase